MPKGGVPADALSLAAINSCRTCSYGVSVSHGKMFTGKEPSPMAVLGWGGVLPHRQLVLPIWQRRRTAADPDENFGAYLGRCAKLAGVRMATNNAASVDHTDDQWLPSSEFKHASHADIEQYGERFFSDAGSSAMEYWIHIASKCSGPYSLKQQRFREYNSRIQKAA